MRDDYAVDACHAFEHAHPAAQSDHMRFHFDHVARHDGPAVAEAFDAGEQRQPLAVLRLGENQNRADLAIASVSNVGGNTDAPFASADR